MLDIQRHGRWKSLTVFGYVGQTAQERLAVTNAFLGQTECAGDQSREAAMAMAMPVAADAQRSDKPPSAMEAVLRAAASKQPSQLPAAGHSLSKSKKKSGRKRRGRASCSDDEHEQPTPEELEAERVEELLRDEEASQGYGYTPLQPHEQQQQQPRRSSGRKKSSSGM
jgi:hypothetical protein